MKDQAKTLFYDGQRVRREDLSFLQDNLLEALQHLRCAMGIAGVSWGYRVIGNDATHVEVSPGLAFDSWGRPIILSESTVLDITLNESPIYLCVNYVPVIGEALNGQPVKVTHSVKMSFKDDLPQVQENTGVIPIAQIRPRQDGFDVIQNGQWYLPPLNAGHTGQFLEDDAGCWRYDGDPIVSRFNPHFDTGWATVGAQSDQNIVHNLHSMELLVQLQNQPAAGTTSNRGIGSDFYYELHDENVIRLFNETESDVQLRAYLWRLTEESAGPLDPVADAGIDFQTERGDNFRLDGSDSMAFEGRSVVRYVWTLID